MYRCTYIDPQAHDTIRERISDAQVALAGPPIHALRRSPAAGGPGGASHPVPDCA